MSRLKIWLIAALSTSILAGCSDDPVPAKKADAPEIVFSASPTQIQPGMRSKLTWKTERATSVRIAELIGDAPVDIGAADPAKGEVTVYPTRSTAYVLHAAGPGGATSASVTVGVELPDKPVVSLKANPAKLDFGGSTKLTWEVEGAIRMRLYAGTDELLEDEENFAGTLTVQPARTTYYRVVAEGEGGRTPAELPVEVYAVIESFTAPAGPKAIGAEVELSWTTVGADSLVVSNDGGFREVLKPAPASGSLVVPMGPEGKFTLVAVLGQQETVATASVPVLAPPKISSLVVVPGSVTDATEDNPVAVTLLWEVTGANLLNLTAEPGGPIALDAAALTDSKITCEVTGTTTFVLRAENAADYVERFVFVTSVAAPAILDFSASASTVEPGDEVTLTWETTGGVLNELLVDGVTWDLVEASGSATFVVDAETEFVLRVKNAAGAKVESALTVQVDESAEG